MSTEPTTIEHFRALAAAVRDGELTPEQTRVSGQPAFSLGTATTLAPCYPDSDAAALGYLIAFYGVRIPP